MELLRRSRAARTIIRALALVAFGTVLFPALVVPPSAAAAAIEYYVAPGGTDAWEGSRTRPFATLARAQAAARAATANMTGDVVINIRGGTYRLDQPLELTAADSGTNGHRIIYQAYRYGNQGQEQVVISGGRSVTGWTLDNPSRNIWRADVGNLETRQLYVNGQRAPRASIRNTYSMTETPVGYTLASFDIANWSNPADIEAVYTRTAVNWAEPRCGIASIAASTIIMDQPCFSRLTGSAFVGTSTNRAPTAFENSKSFLTKPGTFVLDRSEIGHHALYYIPRPGEDLLQADVVAPTLENLVRGKGTAEAPVHDITFQGFTFAHATWLYPSTEEGFVHHISEQYFASDPTVYPYVGDIRHVPGNLVFHYANRITLQGNRFEHLGSTALEIAGSDNIVQGNVITDTSSGGITVGNAQPETRNAISKSNLIANNWIHDVGVEFAGGTGITALHTTDVVIAHNQINSLPDRGIFVCGDTPTCTGPNGNRGARILNNLIFDVMKVIGDGAGIYAVGKQGDSYENGTVIQGNVVHDTDSQKEVVGDFRGDPIDIALYTDFGAQWVTLEKNFVYNTRHSAGGLSAPGVAQAQYLRFLGNFWVDDHPWWPVGPPMDVTEVGNTTLPRENAEAACRALSSCTQILEGAGLELSYRHLLGT